MDELSEHEKIALRDFLADKWGAFVVHCGDMGADANEIYVKLGGEPE